MVSCLDTYALMEIYEGNKKFMKYFNTSFVIPEWTLAEFYWVLLREYGQKDADFWFYKVEGYSKSIDKETLRKAVKFRYANRKKKLSFFDAVGYVFSMNKGYVFVTGDKEFDKFKGVEFIKKS